MEFLKILPPDVKDLVKAYASDKVGVHPAAALIKTLKFSQSFGNERLPSTVVQCPRRVGHFMNANRRFFNSSTSYRRYIHTDFDERHFLHHFDISLRWDNMREQDEIEAMGAEDC